MNVWASHDQLVSSRPSLAPTLGPLLASRSFISIAFLFRSVPLSHPLPNKRMVCSGWCTEWRAGKTAKHREWGDMLTVTDLLSHRDILQEYTGKCTPLWFIYTLAICPFVDECLSAHLVISSIILCSLFFISLVLLQTSRSCSAFLPLRSYPEWRS